MRPTSFWRMGVNSPRPTYEANANNINEDSIDCGIKLIRCCTSPRYQKLGTIASFVTVLVLVGIAQGTSEKYISISAQQAALEHDFDPNVVEWLLVSHGIVQAIFAILIAYWGSRVHKITWLCSMLIIQSIASLIVIIPTLVHGENSESTVGSHVVDLLCTNRTSASLMNEMPHSGTTLVALFLLQTGISYGFIGFYTLGLTYVDDNTVEHMAPALIGAALAGKYLGYQCGYSLSLLLQETSLGWWFGWSIIAPIIFILAIVVGLFPSRLLATAVRQAANTIVETAISSSQLSLARGKLLSDISFVSSIKRILRNKILLLNILAAVFIETALVNYALQEQNYLQSRFLLPADSSELLKNEWTSRTITKFLQPVMVALAILIGGLVIAKANPSSRKIVFWNILTALIVCLLFVAFIFLQCSHSAIAGAVGGKLTLPFCSHSCTCDPDIRFTPVCPANSVQTYFSPCHAGCASENIVNGQRVFGNCSCGIDTELALNGEGVYATEGACGYDDCQKFWIIFQVLVIFGCVCVGSRLIGKILISIRSVLPQDKALALATELTLIGFVAYVPGKIAYEAIADWSCQYWSLDHTMCFLHDSTKFGNTLNALSAILCLIAVVMEIAIFVFVKDLALYGEDNEDGATTVYRPIELQNMRSNQSQVDGDGQAQAQAQQPLLTHLDTTPGIHTIQESQQMYANEPTLAPQQSPKDEPSTSRKGVPVKFVVKRKLAHNHIEELNFRLQQANQAARTQTTDDVNPSVGDASDKDSDVNIQHLESTVSSLSGHSSNGVTSPETKRNKRRTKPATKPAMKPATKPASGYTSIETDF